MPASTKKKYRAVYGLSDAQKEIYYSGWGIPTSRTLTALTDVQAEFQARFREAPKMILQERIKTAPFKSLQAGKEVEVSLTLIHLYEVTQRKVF